MAKKFYAVKKGKTPGIYFDWDSCKAQVDGFSGAEYKSFKTIEEAQSFITGEQPSATAAFGDEKNTSKRSGKAAACEGRPTVPEGQAIAYVDGSYNDLTKRYAYGVVLFTDKDVLEFCDAFSDEEMAEMRNVAGEISGASFAMKYAMDNGIKTLTIYHDYEGIAKWCTGEWKTNKEGTKNYKKLYSDISKNVSIKFIKVKAHSNDLFNDRADELAKSALGLV